MLPSLASGGPEDDHFFETKIRPVLAARCFSCHGARKATQGLRVDSREALLAGGDDGAAIVPGDPDASLLVRAIRYREERKMPPDKPLPAEVVADIERWITIGAPWPTTARSAADSDPTWAFHPVQAVTVPQVAADAGSADNPIDRFVLAKLRERGLQPAAAADKPTLLRRATFDLTGLPPTPDELDAFLADESPAAFATVVDRLLASPHYGERWGRHWLDLVRYTDEFDEAWRYRDWVVNAFNADLPYDEFVQLQVAGDLLRPGQPASVNSDGIVATTMLSIGPWSGIDRKKRMTDIVDDQIDTLTRSVLGLTIACARCHDHKFDPITTADYYGLAGIFFSSHVVPEEGYLSHGTTRLKIPLADEAEVARHREHDAHVAALEHQVQASVDQHYAGFARGLLPQIDRYLLAAWDYEHRPQDQIALTVDDFAKREALHGFAIRQWIDYLKGPPLGAFQTLSIAEPNYDGEPGVLAWRAHAERPWWALNTNAYDVPIETFNLPPRALSINPGTEGGAASWTSPIAARVRITGTLTDDDPYDGVGVAWAIDHFHDGVRHELSSGTSPKGTVRLADGRTPERLTAIEVQPGDQIQLQVRLRQGDAHYDVTTVEFRIEAGDGTTWDLTADVSANFLESNPHADSLGHTSVWQFLDMAGSHRLERMPAVDPLLARWRAEAAKGASADRGELQNAAAQLRDAVAASGNDSPLVHDLSGVRSPFLVRTRDDAKYFTPEAQADLANQAAELDALKKSLPPLAFANGVQEGGLRFSQYPGLQDAPIHVSGRYDSLSERVPRHIPAALANGADFTVNEGSGRRELARWLGSPQNPLTARVLVNRLWQHHFGEGLVRTPSNFGALGERPTHAELLDFLAAQLVESGWSIKALHRLLMLSATYQQSSVAGEEILNADPENRLFGRQNRRRLEAEALHDALLAIADRLDSRAGGPADGEAASPRRMLYIKTTRNTAPGFGPLFDAANPAMHVERRAVSTVAPQALYLMNDPLITDTAKSVLGRSEVAGQAPATGRIQFLYRRIFGRSPSPAEVERGVGFLEQIAAGPAPPFKDNQQPGDAWNVYTQALLLTNEFLFLD
ncbi:MAG: PSD1 and planctomycete cytochrome C domain-containing protein [Planctomycetaceae bacterium]